MRATTTSVRWPTTSCPSRIHDRRASSRRIPVASPIAPATVAARPGGSRTARVMSARRARAASRPSRSATLPAFTAFGPALGAALATGRDSIRCGRSMTSRSIVRPDSSEPAIAIPSSTSAGVTTTSHSGFTPRAIASTGSNASARSSHATIAPAAWASAASRRASVVRPLDRSPRSETPMPRGRPPGPRIASSAAKPVEKTFDGSVATLGRSPVSDDSSGASSGTVASAPTTSPIRAGAAAPHFVRSVARAAVTSGESIAMARLSNRCSNESRPERRRIAPPCQLDGAGVSWISTSPLT